MKPLDLMCPACKAPPNTPCLPFARPDSGAAPMKGFHSERKMPPELDAIAKVVLAYRPKPKSKAAKKRVRKAKKDANENRPN